MIKLIAVTIFYLMTPEKDDFMRMMRGKTRLPNSAAGLLPNRIWMLKFPLSADAHKIAQVTDIQKILGDGRVFFGA